MKHSNHMGKLHNKFRLAKRFRQEMTPSERLLWSRLRGNRLMGLHFRRQHVLWGFIVYFYYHNAKLVVEIDGVAHDSKLETDRMRDVFLKSYGLTALHLPVAVVERDLDEAVRVIREKCRKKILRVGDHTV